MPYYTGNAGLIGPGISSQPIGVYDIDFARLNPPVTFTPASINGFAAYMRNYLSEIRNTGFYSYLLDGDEFTITDGGNDMFDAGGNSTYPWFAANTPVYSSNANGSQPAVDRLSYNTTTAQIVDTNMYYVSLGYNSATPSLAIPLSLIGARTGTNQTIGFQKTGDSGADGAGTLDSGLFYNANTVQGFTVTAFRRQTYSAAADPTHCDIYMIIGHPAWGSVYGTINTFAHPVSNGTQGGHTYMTGTTNVIAITSLLSRTGSTGAVLNAELTTVVDAWVNRLKLYYGL